MSNQQHTAGPWMRYDTSDYATVQDSNGEVLAMVRNGEDADVMAAAPDLLEVAITLRDMLQGLYHGVSWFSKEDEEKIHAAIAKATGEKEEAS